MINKKVEVIHWNGTWYVFRDGEPLLDHRGDPWDTRIPHKVIQALSEAFGVQEEGEDE